MLGGGALSMDRQTNATAWQHESQGQGSTKKQRKFVSDISWSARQPCFCWDGTTLKTAWINLPPLVSRTFMYITIAHLSNHKLFPWHPNLAQSLLRHDMFWFQEIIWLSFWSKSNVESNSRLEMIHILFFPHSNSFSTTQKMRRNEEWTRNMLHTKLQRITIKRDTHSTIPERFLHRSKKVAWQVRWNAPSNNELVLVLCICFSIYFNWSCYI